MVLSALVSVAANAAMGDKIATKSAGTINIGHADPWGGDLRGWVRFVLTTAFRCMLRLLLFIEGS